MPSDQLTSAADARSVATLRGLALDQVQAAKSGHPGFPLGAAPILHTLFSRFIVADPARPDWVDRDRFVLSAGHGSSLLYAVLHLAGYAVSLDDLRAFRQWGSITPGHPEVGVTPGVEATTGPLGQGLANAVGMAIAETMLAQRLGVGGGSLIDHRTFALVSDGDLMEGISLEAAALAGVLGLGKLVVFYDDNGVVIDSAASATHDASAVCAALAAYGWHVSEQVDGEDVDAIADATRAALADPKRPSLVRVRTTIGHGSAYAGTPKVHGGALDDADAARVKAGLGPEFGTPFTVPADVRAWWGAFAGRGTAARKAWEERLDDARSTSPGAVAELERLQSPAPMSEAELRALVRPLADPEPARFTGGRVMAALAPVRTELVGGAADLVAATLTYLADGGDYSRDNRAGRNIRFGVREHAMGGIANGIALHGLLRPFASTFLVFASYQAGALRMAGLQRLPVIHVLTHDSITVGEDGPTHQPIEQLSMLRATPNTLVLRPADGEETIACWAMALNHTSGPTALVLSRIALPPLDRSRAVGDVTRGGYLVHTAPEGTEPEIDIVASGSEVSVAVGAADVLAGRGIVAQVVSLPSHELFLEQDSAYRDSVLVPGRPRLVVEAGSTPTLWRFAGPAGDVYGIDRFGASAPPTVLLERYGLMPEPIADAAERVVRAARVRGSAKGDGRG